MDIKKEKKSYIIIYKSDEKIISFYKINTIIYNKLNNIAITNVDTSDDNSINYHELFYIKQGISITYNNNIWNDLISIYLKKTELIYLIDENYIKNIYSHDIVLFLIDDYKHDIKQFLINYYNNHYKIPLDNLSTILLSNDK